LTTAIWVVVPKIISGIIATATPLVRLPGGVGVSPPNPWAIAVDRLSPFPNSEPADHLILFALYFLVWASFIGYRAFMMPQLGTPFYVSYGTLSVLAWFFWRAMYRRRRRSPDLAPRRRTRTDEGNT
jgi:hypothetical protein